MKEVQAGSWTYQNYRQQKKLRSNLQLFKVLSMVQDKIRATKFVAMARIKEVGQERGRHFISGSSSNQKSEAYGGITPSTEAHTMFQVTP